MFIQRTDLPLAITYSSPGHHVVQEVIKAAEEHLKSVSQQPGYGIAVLKVRLLTLSALLVHDYC
jgi:hypothetical protein